MQQFLLVFPTLLAGNHFVMSAAAPFYNAFNFEQKCEWLAWTNTVIFQTSFTVAYFWMEGGVKILGPMFLAYILCDTVFLPLYNRDNLMYVHHAVSIISLIVFRSLNLVEAVANGAIYLESSNILLGIAWLLNRAGYGKTILTKIVGGLALIVYVVNRAFLFPYHTMFVAPRAVSIGMLPFLPMNYYWAWKLIGYYAYIAFGKKLGQ